MDRIGSPAARVIAKCGNGNYHNGLSAIAGWTGMHTTRIDQWTQPKGRHGTGGLIPVKHWHSIIVGAGRSGIVLEPSDFYFTVAELRAGVAA
jgi:hypothetical protein